LFECTTSTIELKSKEDIVQKLQALSVIFAIVERSV